MRTRYPFDGELTVEPLTGGWDAFVLRRESLGDSEARE